MALSGLPLFHRVAGKRVVVLGQGPAADAKRRLIERAGGECCGEPEAHHARLAIVALDDPRAADAAAARLRGKGLLVNVADRPELCDFTLPSVLERGPMLLAVSSGGLSAGLTKAVRLRLETLLPAGIGRLAEAFGAARERIKQRWPDPAERRRALDSAVAEGGPLDLMGEHDPDAIEAWLASPGAHDADRRIEIVLASNDPDDLTLRQARMLGEADTLVYDPAVPQAILARARADAMRQLLPTEGAKRPGLTVVLRARDPQ